MNTAVATATAYEMIGGGVVRRIVDRFYDLMDQEPQYAALRAMHAADLAPMRDSLTGFLTAWLGGPRDWFEQRPGACVMSAHAKVPVSPATADQWVDAMRRALVDAGVDPQMGRALGDTFARMAAGMARR